MLAKSFSVILRSFYKTSFRLSFVRLTVDTLTDRALGCRTSGRTNDNYKERERGGQASVLRELITLRPSGS